MLVRASLLFLIAVPLAACAGTGGDVTALAPAEPRVAAPPAAIPAPEPARVDFVLVQKAARRLTLFAGGRPIKTYGGLQLGDAPIGPKHFEGDERTPEGRYWINYRNPRSAYHLSLHISYPDAKDRAFAAARGYSPGGAIFIHGQPNGLAAGRMEGDWTDGCIALSNAEIEELWDAIPDGTEIQIDP